MALNVYQTPVMVLGAIAQEPNHLNIFQHPIMVLGAVAQEPYHLNLFQMPVMILGTTEIVEAPFVASSENPNTKNRMLLGVG